MNDREIGVIRISDTRLKMRFRFDDGYEIGLEFDIPEILDTSKVKAFWANDVTYNLISEEAHVCEVVRELGKLMEDDL